jgi:flagellar P-ring protein precursor FlgI
MTLLRKTLVALVVLTVLIPAAPSTARGPERIKDIVRFDDEVMVPLIGTGLVIGLAGTGDGNGFEASIEALVRNLERLGVTVDPNGLRTKNVAMVQITASVRSRARPGDRFDVTVSSIGDAKSLEGGTLLAAALNGVTDGETYAIASGQVSIGGFNVESGANNRVQKNHATVGLVSSGGQVHRALPGGPRSDHIGLLLNHPDRSTASNVARAINARFPSVARAEDAGFVRVYLPDGWVDDPVGFMAELGEIRAATDAKARVVVNERTGTIVVGGGVRLREAAVAHGSLNIEIRTRYRVSQPNSFNESGETVVVPDVQTFVNDAEAHVLRLPDTVTVQDIVDVLNGMGASPRDIIAMLQALRAAGSLQAELEVM